MEQEPRFAILSSANEYGIIERVMTEKDPPMYRLFTLLSPAADYTQARAIALALEAQRDAPDPSSAALTEPGAAP